MGNFFNCFYSRVGLNNNKDCELNKANNNPH